MGVFFSGALIGVGVEGVAFLSGVDMPTLWPLLGGLALFTALELHNRRASNRRIAVGIELLVQLTQRCEPTRAGWFRGLPYLRGKIDGVLFAAHLEHEGDALRFAVAVEIEPESPWIATAAGPGRPSDWLDDLVANQGFSWVDEQTIARDVEDAQAVLDTPVGVAAQALAQAVDGSAATVEVGRDSGRWDVALNGVSADIVCQVVRGLGALDTRPAESGESVVP